MYQRNLKTCSSLNLPLPQDDNCENIYWVFGVVSFKRNKNAKWWISKLLEKGIGTRPFFYPMHLQPCLNMSNVSKLSLENSERLSEHGFYLPSSPTLSRGSINNICDILLEFCFHDDK